MNNLSPETRKYLADIGRKGGLTNARRNDMRVVGRKGGLAKARNQKAKKK